MSKLTVVVGVIVAAAGAGAIFVQQQSITQLRRDVAALRAENGQVARAQVRAVNEAKAEGARASFVVTDESPETRAAGAGEIAKLRTEVEGLKKSAAEFGKLVQAAQAKAAEANIPTNLVPVSQWKDGGRATAGAALKTVMWAAAGGEVDALAQGLGFTASARAKADAWFGQLSEGTRQQYGSPEKVIALMIAKDAAAVSGMQVLRQKEVTPDDVGMRVRFGTEDGKTKDDTFFFHRAVDGWKLVLSDAVVDRFAKQLAQQPPTK